MKTLAALKGIYPEILRRRRRVAVAVNIFFSFSFIFWIVFVVLVLFLCFSFLLVCDFFIIIKSNEYPPIVRFSYFLSFHKNNFSNSFSRIRHCLFTLVSFVFFFPLNYLFFLFHVFCPIHSFLCSSSIFLSFLFFSFCLSRQKKIIKWPFERFY